MKTSVIISAFNGQKYIIDQLQSILDQTVSVDEILIYDDCSSDSTCVLVNSFVKKNNIENCFIECNKTNQGFLKNFINGLYKTTGDIIFFADQDDIWCNNKVQRTISLFKTYPDMLSLTSTFSRFNNDGVELISHVIHPHRKKKGIKRVTLDDFCSFSSYLGMATAVNRKLIQACDLRLYYKFYEVHDKMVNFMAVVFGGLYHIDEVLVKRRSYADSVSNKLYASRMEAMDVRNPRITNVISASNELESNIRLLTQEKFPHWQEDVIIVKKYLYFNKMQYNYLSLNNFSGWLKSLMYIRYYSSWKTFLKDGISIVNFKMIKRFI